jgi:hypothetical protein
MRVGWRAGFQRLKTGTFGYGSNPQQKIIGPPKLTGLVVRLTSYRKTLLLWNLNSGGQGSIWDVGPLDGWMEFYLKHLCKDMYEVLWKISIFMRLSFLQRRI